MTLLWNGNFLKSSLAFLLVLATTSVALFWSLLFCVNLLVDGGIDDDGSLATRD